MIKEVQVKMKSIYLAISCLTIFSCASPKGDETLKAGLLNPPDSVRPVVYWDFMDGNLSSESHGPVAGILSVRLNFTLLIRHYKNQD